MQGARTRHNIAAVRFPRADSLGPHEEHGARGGPYYIDRTRPIVIATLDELRRLQYLAGARVKLQEEPSEIQRLFIHRVWRYPYIGRLKFQLLLCIAVIQPILPGAASTTDRNEDERRIPPCNLDLLLRVFQEAVKKGNTKELHSLLQNMTNCEFNVNSFGPEGQTALHQSVIDGNLELVKLLVKFGADIRLANREGWSALHIAAFGGHQDIVLYLITKAKYSSGAR
ncbi:hypothetical protein UPYG_G00286530 [Umbra pygmaea]|uniref:Notch-regulated ankyrin repeat-containing protein n=1 Tax=Umbra pygmaea TaxID=75934 RepID=A0ABD0WNI3_UMBPY